MTQVPPPAKTPLSLMAIKGTLWEYSSFALGKALAFVSTVILARVLAPEHFGVVGYCLVAIQYLDILNTFGMDSALISRHDKTTEAANAAFVVGLMTSGALLAVAWLSAPAIANFFNEPEVAPLFRVLALTLPITALGVVPHGFIKKRLQFRAKLVPDLSRTVIKGGLSIALALLGYGIWSLIWGQVVGELTSTAIFWALAKWKPTGAFDRQVTREMLSFGLHLIVVGIIGALLSNADYLFVGRLLGAAALGYYTLAYRVPELIINNLNYVVARVAHPVLSQAQLDAGKLNQLFYGYVRYISMFTLPAGVGLALIAPAFIRAFYTDKWEPSIGVMQGISIAIGIASIGHIPGVLYKAVNRPEILTRLAWVKLPYTLGILWFATRWGIAGVALGQIVIAVFNVSLDVWMVGRVVKAPVAKTLSAIGPALVSTTAMGLALGAVALWLAPDDLLDLFVMLVIGAAVYAGALAVVSRETLTQAGGLLRAVFKA